MESIQQRIAKAAPALATIAAVRRPSMTRQLLAQPKVSEGVLQIPPWASPAELPSLFPVRDLSIKDAPKPEDKTIAPIIHIYAIH
jgi:hypothetical protein